MWFATRKDAEAHHRMSPHHKMEKVVRANKLTVDGPVPGYTVVLKEDRHGQLHRQSHRR